MMNEHIQAGGAYGPPPGGAPPGGGMPGAPGGYGAPPGAPPGGAPMAPPGGGMMPGGPPGGAGGGNADLKKQAQTWLIVNLATWFLCGNGCFGIIGAIMGYLAMQAADQGNLAEAEGKIKWSKICAIVGLVLMVLLIIVYVILMAVGMAGSM